MTWVIFDVADRETPAPNFALRNAYGDQVSREDYYEKRNLVLLFLNEGDRQALARFAARRVDYERQLTEIVAVVPEIDPAYVEEYKAGEIPFPLLADPDGSVRQDYAGMMVADLIPEGSVLLFVLDLYGAPYAAYIGPDAQAAGLQDEVLSWLVYIGVQCPE